MCTSVRKMFMRKSSNCLLKVNGVIDVITYLKKDITPLHNMHIFPLSNGQFGVHEKNGEEI